MLALLKELLFDKTAALRFGRALAVLGGLAMADGKMPESAQEWAGKLMVGLAVFAGSGTLDRGMEKAAKERMRNLKLPK